MRTNETLIFYGSDNQNNGNVILRYSQLNLINKLMI